MVQPLCKTVGQFLNLNICYLVIPLLDRYVDIYPSEIIAKVPTITCTKTGPECPTSLGKQTVVCTFVIFIQMNTTQQ